MFPYRRPGQKKRPKNIPNRNRVKGPPPRGLPTAARELLPMLQPATKALAHMLAGRTQQSGQYGHARAILARAERTVAERATDRLTPAEREEFFEQLARLKLTLSDADLEAEVGAAEEAEPPKPAAPPVDRQRLRELALTLATPAPPAHEPRPPAVEAAAAAPERTPTAGAATPGRGPASSASSSPLSLPAAPPASAAPPPVAAARAVERTSAVQPGGQQRPTVVATARRRTSRGTARRPAPDGADVGEPAAAEAGNGRAQKRETGSTPPGRPAGAGKALHLPDGWMIDEEGFVVPRSG